MRGGRGAMRGGGFSRGKKNDGKKKEKRPAFMVVNGVENWKPMLNSLQEFIVVSVDPGLINLGFRIERRTRLSQNSNYCSVETLVMERIEFSFDFTSDSMPVFNTVSKFLDLFSNYYPRVCVYMVEQQQIPEAYKIIRIAQHITTYFSMITRAYPGAIVAEISPKAKTKFLGAPPKMGREGTVEWGRNEGLKYLHMRKDLYGLNRYHTYQDKADDIMVTVIQVEAIFKHLGLPTTPDADTGSDVY